jgi:hypothetical protein
MKYKNDSPISKHVKYIGMNTDLGMRSEIEKEYARVDYREFTRLGTESLGRSWAEL